MLTTSKQAYLMRLGLDWLETDSESWMRRLNSSFSSSAQALRRFKQQHKKTLIASGNQGKRSVLVPNGQVEVCMP